jgi:hypothetical protein
MLDMCFSLAFVLTAFSFLSAATPLANTLTSAGISVPITKRSALRNGVIGASKLQSAIRRSVA